MTNNAISYCTSCVETPGLHTWCFKSLYFSVITSCTHDLEPLRNCWITFHSFKWNTGSVLIVFIITNKGNNHYRWWLYSFLESGTRYIIFAINVKKSRCLELDAVLLLAVPVTVEVTCEKILLLSFHYVQEESWVNK